MKKIESVKLQDLDNSLFDEFKKDELDNLVEIAGGRGGVSISSQTGPDVGEATMVGNNSDEGTASDGTEIEIC